MATRRSRPAYTPEDLLRLSMSVPLAWPGRTVRLERDSLFDYHGRSASAQVSVAELYHENSKLSVEMLPELVHTAVDAARFRREFLRRRAVVARAHADGREVDDFWADLIRQSFEGNPDLAYAIELRLLVGTAVYAAEPAGTLRLLRRLDPAGLERLAAALALLEPSPCTDRAAVLFVLGCFPRNEILLGRRGYRRTLLEAGRVAQEIVQQAERLGRGATVRYEFSDRDVDLLMEADGVEQSVILTVEFD